MMDVMMPGEPFLEIVEATVLKRDVRALDGLSLTLRFGEHTAIVGPNGSGKSALINLLIGEHYALARPEGPPPVRLFGADRWDLSEVRGRLGVVSADVHQRFVAGNSVGPIRAIDAVLSAFFAGYGFIFGMPVTEAMRSRAAAALARVGASHLASTRLDEMSTGEARRVLIARALATDPEVLVLDEPAAGLDLVARRKLLEDVRAIARGGTTIVLVTHHVDEIVPEIERVIFLKRGRVAAAGPKRTTLTPETLAAVFDEPLHLRERDGYYSVGL